MEECASTKLYTFYPFRFIDTKIGVNTINNTSKPVPILGQIVHLVFFLFCLVTVFCRRETYYFFEDARKIGWVGKVQFVRDIRYAFVGFEE